MTNVATLIPNDKGERRGGRKPGVDNLLTRAMRTACMLAAETSVHSNGTLVAYLKFLADHRPELFAPMLMRLIPQQAKVQVSHEQPQRLTPDMPLHLMVAEFEARIKDPNYHPPSRVIDGDVIEHDDADGDD